MEIQQEVKQESLEFPFGDAVILVKKYARSFDKFSTRVQPGSPEFMESCIKQMVTGWKNITSDGKPVPYSFEALKRIPELPGGENVFIMLAAFILEKTDIASPSEADAKAKNG